MTDQIADTWKRDEPDSPCVNICLIHPAAKICVGCFRTASEISEWHAMEPQARRQLRAQLPERAGQIKPVRRGGARRRRKGQQT